MKHQEIEKAIKSYLIDNDFIIDIEQTGQFWEAWLYHVEYGVKVSLLGLSSSQIEKHDDFLNNYLSDLTPYINDYKMKYMEE